MPARVRPEGAEIIYDPPAPPLSGCPPARSICGWSPRGLGAPASSRQHGRKPPLWRRSPAVGKPGDRALVLLKTHSSMKENIAATSSYGNFRGSATGWGPQPGRRPRRQHHPAVRERCQPSDGVGTTRNGGFGDRELGQPPAPGAFQRGRMVFKPAMDRAEIGVRHLTIVSV